MSISDFIDDAERSGGKWFKCFNEGDTIDGELVNIDVIERRDPNGQVTISKKSGKARKVYRITFKVTPEDTDDDGLRVWDANESAQIAIRDAYKKVGTKELIGGRIKIRVTESATRDTQATYQARFEAAPKKVELPEEEPW